VERHLGEISRECSISVYLHIAITLPRAGGVESQGSRLPKRVPAMPNIDIDAMRPFLERLMVRSSLDDDEQAAILALPFRVFTVPANRDIVSLGEEMDHACLIVTGIVGRFEQTASGDRQITALHIPGDMANLHSVVLPKTSWALGALTASKFAKIPHLNIIAVAECYPAIGRAFWRDCSVDASILAGWAVGIGRRSAKSRLAHLICELQCRYKAIGLATDDGFDWPMGQAQIADALGLTPIHVNRMIATINREGLAQMAGRRLTVLDWAALMEVADFDPAYLHLKRQRGTAAVG
jgi:CRP-like cAMP-binding protein